MSSVNQVLAYFLATFSVLLIGALMCRQYEAAVFFGLSLAFSLIAEAFSVVSGGMRSRRDLM